MHDTQNPLPSSAAAPWTAPHQRIAVLGAGGFLGSHLVETLIVQTPCHVLAVDRSFTKLTVRSPRLELVEGTIEDRHIITHATTACDTVVSMTALCNPALYNTLPLEVIHESFTHLLPLVAATAAAGKRLVHFSTCEVYGRGTRDACGRAETMNEDESALVLGPIAAERWTYSAAKQLLERLIYGYGAHHGLDFTIIRPFNVIGPRMDYLTGVDGEGIPRVLARFIGALLAGTPLELVDGGWRRRSFVHVAEFTQGVVRILNRREACKRQIINLGATQNEVSIRTLAEKIVACWRELYGSAPEPAWIDLPAEAVYGKGYDDVDIRLADLAKAEHLLDWRAHRTLDEMLPEIISDYVARYGAERGAR